MKSLKGKRRKKRREGRKKNLIRDPSGGRCEIDSNLREFHFEMLAIRIK